MVHWTDSNINWQSLNAREIRRLINTWGTEPKPTKAAKKPRQVKVTVPTTFAVERAGARVTVQPARTKRTGADGEVRWVPERGMYYGFFGGRAVFARKTLQIVVQHVENNYKIPAKVAA